MKSPRVSTLNNGNKIQPRAGRQEGNKIKKAMELIKEENVISLYNMQLDLATNSPNEDTRVKCSQFLLDKVLPKAPPLPQRTYVSITLLPMDSIENIRENESIVLKYVSNGSLSLEEGRELLAITEQGRKTWECTEGARMHAEIKQMWEDAAKGKG
jgi:hypothetical protein